MKPKLFLLGLLLSCGLAVQGQEWAKARLEKSPRHGEWVDVKNGDRSIHCFVAYPEVKNPAAAVIVIHEIFGMTDWVRGVADQVAEAGYVAIAPDLLSGMGPNGGGSSDFKSGDDVRNAIFKLTPDKVASDLHAVAEYAKSLPSVNGKLAVAGFCWGGGQSFNFACHEPDLKAAFVFYGPPPPAAEMKKIQCPVLGFYAEKDSRITSTLPKAETDMKAAGKTFEPVTYDGAGHGFMRLGEDPGGSAENKAARDKAWTRLKDALKGL
ncbi:MAG TPA: dienelactone hydrolase family protein [Verrucomicrobiae bacterium]|jgi:carboxymethylenebutenolidase|nr:dienelactone hydrolase family protein [Verrucomicrobiae bacterium]